VSDIAAGWYRDPVDPDTQRYWDGEQWIGEAIPAGTVPPPGPVAAPEPVAPAAAEPAQPDTGQYGQAPYAYPGYGQGHAGPAAAEVPLPGTLAPVVDRLAARLIDGVVLFLLNVVVNGWFVYQYVREMYPALQRAEQEGLPLQETITDRAATLTYIILGVATALWFAYEVPAVAATGQTLGKRLVGVRVVGVDGSPLGFGRSIQRWALPGLPTMLGGWLFPLQLADALWCLWDRPRQQCLHDKAAGTIVVTAPALTGVPPKTH
jgi:uncharacterized RDD family membrane protein YckC